MDIAALSMALSSQKIGTEIGVAVTRMAMDTSKENVTQFVQDMMKTMELSVNPNVGSKIDVRI